VKPLPRFLALTGGAFVAGLVLLGIVLAVLGYDPGAAFRALISGSLGSWHALSSATLVRATPLILLGLGFSLAWRAGGLNIGMEGQFLAGAIGATWIGLHAGALPGVVAQPLVMLGGLAAGAVWIALPVFLKQRFGVLEVISTLLLNFVAEALVSWMVLGPLQEAKRTYPQSDLIAVSAQLPHVPGGRLHAGFLVVILLALGAHLLFHRTMAGFQLRATGMGPVAARLSGRIPVNRVLVLALLGSGALAGLGGGMEVSGVTYALYQNLSPGYGFTAIAVALLARGEPIAIIGTGLLFGALEAGAGAMQREAGIPAVAVAIVQATIIIAVLVTESIGRRRLRALTPAGAA
jgi:simple sugar transport system permease protein